MAKLTLKDLKGALEGKKVLVRVDYNVPVDKATGAITDDRRIRETLPTIKFIQAEGGKPVLISHMGRPKGERKPATSLAGAAARLGELLGRKVVFGTDCIGPEAEKAVAQASATTCVVLENLRYHAEEEKNDPAFAAALAAYGEVFVQDAFGAVHRAHASTAAVAAHFPGKAAAGFLVERELRMLGTALAEPKRPFVAIIGGAKISGKIDVLKSLLPKVDALIIGGGMAYTFYKAMGLEIGTSLLEADKIDVAAQVLADVAKHPKLKFYLPLDTVVAAECAETAVASVVPRDRIPADKQGLDIGPETRALYAKVVEQAKTVVWNGPMGVFELKPFAAGTLAVAKALAAATAKGAMTIVGGGDSASAIEEAGLADKVSHVSTGGGASLEFLEGKVLPGVAALSDAG